MAFSGTKLHYTRAAAEEERDIVGNDAIIIATDSLRSDGSLTKAFMVFESWKVFWKKYVKTLGPARDIGMGMYEIIRDDRPCRLYADLDWLKDEFNQDEEWVKSKFTEIVGQVLKSIDKDAFDDYKRGHHFTVSSRENKGSLHYVNSKVGFKNRYAHSQFMSVVFQQMLGDPELWFLTKQKNGFKQTTFIDFCVYDHDRQMRLVYSCKMLPNSGDFVRPLVPDDIGLFDRSPQKFIIMWTDAKMTSINTTKIDHITETSYRRLVTFDEEFIQKIVDRIPGLSINTIKNNFQGHSNTTIVSTRQDKKLYKCELCGNDGGECHPRLIINKSNGTVKKRCFSSSSEGREAMLYIQPQGIADKVNSLDTILQRLVWDFRQVFPEGDDIDEVMHRAWMSKTFKFINEYAVKINAPRALVSSREFDAAFGKGESSVLTWKTRLLGEFEKCHSEYSVKTVDGKNVSLIKLWAGSEISARAKKDFMVCNPSINDVHAHNTFTGLKIGPVEALAGDFDKGKNVADFIKRVWCGGDEVVYTYTVNWFAHLIQRPGELIKTALCIRGDEGTGKSSIVNMVRGILGSEHAFQESNANNVFGEFNSLVHNKFLCFLDEALFAGNKAIVGKVKAMVTEEEIQINIKGLPQFKAQNSMNLVIASNDEFFVRASSESRRWHILETSNEAHDYSPEMKNEIFGLDPIHFARFLYEVDISEWEPSKIPETEVLQQQRAYSSPQADWLYSLMMKDGSYDIELGEDVGVYLLYESYKPYDSHCTINAFSRQIRKLKTTDGVFLFTGDKNKIVREGKRQIKAIKTPTRKLLETYLE